MVEDTSYLNENRYKLCKREAVVTLNVKRLFKTKAGTVLLINQHTVITFVMLDVYVSAVFTTVFLLINKADFFPP